MRKTQLLKRAGAILLATAMVAGVGAPYAVVEAELVRGSKFLGNIIPDSVPSNFAEYWNQVTPENASKWGSVESSRDSMSWKGVDTCYDYAESKKMPFKFHTLVWGSQEPGWISGIPAADQKEEVLEWIEAAAKKYGDSEYVDVVNEPLHAKPSYRNAIGGDGQTGWDWVIWSFEQARKHFKGKLLINEYGIINDSNATKNYIQIINLLKERKLIDGIGIQCHQFNVDTLSTSVMKSNLDALAATGLPIYVSELDITGDDSTQLARYKEKFPVLWEHPAVKGVTLWGYNQGQTWKDNTHLITSSGEERPAMKWLKEYFKTADKPADPTETPADPTTKPADPTDKPADPTETPVQTGDLTLETSVNSWSTGYVMGMTLTNPSSSKVDGWKITVKKSDFKIATIWNAQVKEEGDNLVITPMFWNKTIDAKGKVTIGFQGTGAPVEGFDYTIE